MDYKSAAVSEVEFLLKELGTETVGLSESQVLKQRDIFGANVLSTHETKPIYIFIDQFKSSFVYLLIIASGISFLLDEKIDGFIILAFVIINALLGFWQEYKASVSLNKLRKYITKTSLVKRYGKTAVVDDKDIVVGDIVIVKAGDLIPAEIRFVSGHDIVVDESVLTGESSPVNKISSALSVKPAGVTEAVNVGFSGTVMTSGEAEGVVISVGDKTEVGLISKITLGTEAQSGFSKKISELSKAILWITVGTLALVFLFHIIIGDKNIAQLAVFSIALAVGVIPEALPLVITISLSTGAMRLAKKKVVPKRLSAIEDLGSIDVLCTDKTGTITENKLTVMETFGSDDKRLYELALFGSPPDTIDSFDIAISSKMEPGLIEIAKSVKHIFDLPFDPVKRQSFAVVEENIRHLVIVKGAPEEVLAVCAPDFDKEKVLFWLKEQGDKGNRLLAVAYKYLDEDPDPYEKVKDLKFCGVIAFSDIIKESAKQAIQDAESLQVRLKVLTGDSVEVARSVGIAVGIIEVDDIVMRGSDFDNLSDEDKNKIVENIDVFARVSPLQKFDIIKRLQKNHTVGFLGEGFNDAPALKISHVSLVVDNASDIAKETADIILLSKDLKTIIDGIKEGRTTFTNSIKYIRATLISNFGNFFALAVSSLFIPFLPMLPIQILLLNLFSDFPMISISTDTVAQSNLRKPRSYNIKSILILSVLLGFVSTSFDFATFFYFVGFGQGTLQTMWFIESVLTELILLFSIRTPGFFLKAQRPGKFIIGLTMFICVLTIILPFSSFGHEFFGFVSPAGNHITAVLMLVSGYFVVTEAVKLLYYKKPRGSTLVKIRGE